MSKQKSNKIKIAIVVLSVALVAAIGGVFGVYAATQQNVKSSFSVSYSIGDNVAVAIGASYVLSDWSNQTWFTPTENLTMQDNNLYTINASATTTSCSFTGGDIELSHSEALDEIHFYFENISDVPIIVQFQDSSKISENMQVEYLAGWFHGTEASNFNNAEIGGSQPGQIHQIEPGEIFGFIIMLSVKDTNKSASYESTDTAGISFSVQRAN